MHLVFNSHLQSVKGVNISPLSGEVLECMHTPAAGLLIFDLTFLHTKASLPKKLPAPYSWRTGICFLLLSCWYSSASRFWTIC